MVFIKCMKVKFLNTISADIIRTPLFGEPYDFIRVFNRDDELDILNITPVSTHYLNLQLSETDTAIDIRKDFVRQLL